MRQTTREMNTGVQPRSGKPRLPKKNLTPRVKAKRSLNILMERHNSVAARREKTVSYRTQYHRRRFYQMFLADLYDMGYKIEDIHHLKRKHIAAWIEKREAQGLAAATFQTYLSHLRTLCGWIEKPMLMRCVGDYLADVHCLERVYTATEDKSHRGGRVVWEELHAKITAIEPIYAAQATMWLLYGLRFQEAMLLRPNLDDRGDYLEVLIGTKGGRLRRIPIETEGQRQALDHLKRYATSKNGSTIPKTHTFAQWRNRVRWINRSIGFTKKESGYTPHALRHAYLNDLYEKQTGQPSTVRGGTGEGLTREEITEARQRVAEDAGHVRISISNAYLGTIVKNTATGQWEKKPE